MEKQLTQPVGTKASSIHPDTSIGALALTVSDLARSLAYYTQGLGFSVIEQRDNQALLGAGDKPLLHLTEQKGAAAWPRGGASYTGLYHFAILLPTRADLGRWLRHWLTLGMPLPGQGDHLVSEALYLEDPDGHGIEVYRDRPRKEWTWSGGQVQMATDPVDLEGLIAEAEREGKPWAGLPAGTRLGHMHLQVGSIPEAREFYNRVLGFDITADLERMGALFVSAGGYHHHLGLNTWHSRGRKAAPENSVALRRFTIHLPHEEALAPVLQRLDAAGVPHKAVEGGVVVKDPWDNTILLVTGDKVPAELGR